MEDLGFALRIASATLLYALFALHASKAIAWGEWLSQPLLAGLLLLGAAHSLPLTGAAHVMTYLTYAAFNLWAVWWCMGGAGETASQYAQ